MKQKVVNLAKRGRFSGAVLIGNKEKVLFSQAYGLANIDKNILNSIDTKFNLASMNKMFTSLAIAILEEQGQLSLSDTVKKFIPEFPHDKITLHHLLTHSSGVGDFFNDKFLDNRAEIKNLVDYLPLFIEDKLHFEPGTRFQYSNGGIILLGLVIENVSKIDYFEFVTRYIYKPLDMNDTGFFETSLDTEEFAIGYTNFNFDGAFQEEKTNNLSICTKGSSAGGGYSTINDLWKFSVGVLNSKLISADLTATIATEKENIDTNENFTLGYGYGFFVESINRHPIFGHDGGFPGVSNRLDIYPNDDYIFIALSNDDGGGAALTREVRKIITE